MIYTLIPSLTYLLLLLSGKIWGVPIEQECHEPLVCTPVKECSQRLKGHDIPHSEVLFSCNSKNESINVCCPAVESLENFDSTETLGTPIKINDKPNDSVRFGSVGGYTPSRLEMVPAVMTNRTDSSKQNKTCNESSWLQDSLVRHPNINLFPMDQCGVQNVNRIINGMNASLGQFPWMALLGFRLNDGHLYYLCGGSLINKRYVLTAAHCLNIKGAEIQTVRLGEHDQLSEEDCDDFEGFCADPVLELPVDRTIPHERYNTPRLKNDIALLRLNPQVPHFTDYIRPICVPFGIRVSGFEDRVYTVAGWGKLHHDDDFGSQFLQFARIRSNSLDECDARQAKEVRPLDSTQMCAGRDEGKDVCRGDSGGPLMDILQSPATCKTRTFLIGITSFGSVPCGAEYTPSVYTKVTAFLSWILDNVDA